MCRAFSSTRHLGSQSIAFSNSLTRHNPAVYNVRRSCKRRAVNAAVQTQLDVDQFIQHSQKTRANILEVLYDTFIASYNLAWQV